MLFFVSAEVLCSLKILVMGDTHNTISYASGLIEKLNPDYVLHLGDVCADCHRLEDTFPRKLIVSVKGNNDFFDNAYPLERCFELEGKKIFMCHGHKYNVKSSLLPLCFKGREVGADIVLYGHTHSAHLEEVDGMIMMNPGCGGVGKYGIIEIKDGKIKAFLEHDEQ